MTKARDTDTFVTGSGIPVDAVYGPSPEPRDLGNPGEFTVRELAEKILDITGSKSRLLKKPLPADEVQRG